VHMDGRRGEVTSSFSPEADWARSPPPTLSKRAVGGRGGLIVGYAHPDE